jgi:hypothetical protein
MLIVVSLKISELSVSLRCTLFRPEIATLPLKGLFWITFPVVSVSNKLPSTETPAASVTFAEMLRICAETGRLNKIEMTRKTIDFSSSLIPLLLAISSHALV